MTPEPQVVMIGRSRSTPASAKALATSAAGLDSSFPGDLAPRHIAAFRDMPGAQACARFGDLAGKPAGAARVDDLRRTGLARAQHVGGGGDARGVEAGREDPRRRFARPSLERTSLRAPLLQTALQDLDVRRAEEAQRPPDPGGADELGRVIDDKAHAIAEAEFAHGAGELRRRGQHVRQAGRMVGDGVDIEEDRSGDVAGEIFAPRIAVFRRQKEAGVDDREIGRAKMLLEPCRRNKKIRTGACRS